MFEIKKYKSEKLKGKANWEVSVEFEDNHFYMVGLTEDEADRRYRFTNDILTCVEKSIKRNYEKK